MTAITWWRLCFEEVLSALARPGIYVATAFLAGLSVASMIQGREDLQEHRARYNEEVQDRLKAQLRIQAPNGRVVDPGLRVLRPPASSTILVRNSAAALPSGWDLGPAGIEARPPYPTQGSGLETVVSLGLDGIVLVFGGLLSVALGLYQVLTVRGSEWSSAVRALPLPWRSVVGARLVAGALLVALLLGTWWAIVVALAGVIEPVAASEVRWTLLQLLAPTFLYLVTLNAAGMASAMWSLSSVKAVVTGLALWLAVTFVLPQVLALISRTALPRASRHAMERERSEAYADEIKRFEDSIGRTVGLHAPTLEMLGNLESIDDPPIQHLHLDDVWRTGIATARNVARQFDADWLSRQERQRRLFSISLVLSPATAVTAGMSELAGVGRAADHAWETTARDHHNALTEILFDDRPMLNSMVPVGSSFTAFALMRHPPRTHAVFPTLQEPPRDSRAPWQAARSPIAWLLVHAALALIWAYRAGLRDLRRDA